MLARSTRLGSWSFLALVAMSTAIASAAAPYYSIRVVDADTGRGVPLVYLKTTFEGQYVTDSAGYVAFHEPGLMNGDDVWFEVKSYGYETPAGAFGVHGVALKPQPGKLAEIKLKRTQIAERMYRLTGYGIYRDSVLLGLKPPIKQPLLNAKVTGQDTIQTAVYKGRYYWFWQDTDRLGFGLGGFSMTGATAAALPDKLDLEKGIDLTYFVDKPGEFARPMARIDREGTNPIWVDGVTVTRDADGNARMLARYVAVDSKMAPVETGLCLFNDERQVFERHLKFEGNGEATLAPSGRPFRVLDGETRYVYFNESVRVEDRFEAVGDPTQYEVFTCLTRDDADDFERDASGKVRWSWLKQRQRLTDKRLDALVKAGKLKRDDLPIAFVNAEDNKPFRKAAGSIAWNPYLKCWTQLVGESLGASVVGEIWFATANSPEGPWRAARKVATHAMPKNPNDFYNPIQHENLFREGGRYVYFEGTFVNTFSGNPHPTPYYDYNNIMYRIDLADPRMKLPEPPPGLTRVTPAER